MKKRIFSLVMASFMALTVFMTSCASTQSNNNGGEGEIIPNESLTARSPETVTITLMTGEETTDEAIKAVQDAINNITKQKFKTQVVLRYFKESEYEEKLDKLINQISIDQADKADQGAEEESKKKEAERLEAIENLMNKDAGKDDNGANKFLGQEFIERETEEVTTVEHYETDLNILGSSVQRYPSADESQLDIFLVVGTESLTKYVKDEAYATENGSFLAEMDSTLLNANKTIYDYISSSVLLGGKVNNKQYAIPTNRLIASEYDYLVINNEMANKYNIDVSKIENISDDETIKLLKAIKANETDVAPVLEKTDNAPGAVQLFHDKDTIFGTYVSKNAITGLKSSPKNLLSTWQFTGHYIAMKQFERNGYFAENPTDDTEFGVAIMKGTEDFPSTLEKDKYTVKVLANPIATSQVVGEYMLGICDYTENKDRCMELITYINTNSEMRNLLQYGIEGEHYKVIDGENGKTIERLNHNYMMNIYTTGNTFIAYPEEGMDAKVWEEAKLTNQSAVVSPYLGFLVENDKNKDMIEEIKKLSDDVLKQIEEFDPETERIAKIAALQQQLADYEAALQTQKNKFAAVQALYSSFKSKIDGLEATLKAAEEKLSEATAERAPFSTAFSEAQTALDRKSAELASLPATATPEEKAKLEAEIEDLTKVRDEKRDALAPYTEKLNDASNEQKAADEALENALAVAAPANNYNWKTVEDLKKDVTTLPRTISSSERYIETTKLDIRDLQYENADQYDNIIAKIYEEYFKNLAAKLQDNKTYASFMDNENEDGVLYLYNEWYSAMHSNE